MGGCAFIRKYFSYNSIVLFMMVHFCAVPGCSNDSIKKPGLSFHRLPLKNKRLLKVWVHKIGRKNLPVNNNTRVCSEHFIDSANRRLRLDEYPSIKLPVLSTSITNPRKRKSPVKRGEVEESVVDVPSSSDDPDIVPNSSQSCCTELSLRDITAMEEQISEMKKEINDLRTENVLLKFTLLTVIRKFLSILVFQVTKL